MFACLMRQHQRSIDSSQCSLYTVSFGFKLGEFALEEPEVSPVSLVGECRDGLSNFCRPVITAAEPSACPS